MEVVPIPGGKIEILVDPDLRTFPAKLEGGLRSSAGIASSAGKAIAAALGVGLLGAGAGIAAVVKVGNEFDSTLSRIQATSGASAAEMAKVSARARELGTDASLAGTSSSQAASAIEELAKAGLSVNDSMRVARDAIVLSRAGMLEGGEAASLLANTLSTYGLSAADATRVTDVFAAAANASTTDVRDLGESLKYVGPVTAGLKISLEDTTTALALLSTAGIKGSEAGTALRGVLASIAAPSGPAKKALNELGISAFDQTGKFRGLEAITSQLTAAKGRMTDQEFATAAAVAFGNEGMAAANVLATQGVGQFRDLGEAVRQQGAASKAAAANSQGLSGAMDELQGSAEDVALSIYDLIKGPLADLARGGADGLQNVSDLLAGKGIDAGGLERVLEAGRKVLVNLGVAAEPVRKGLSDLFASFERGNGATSIFTGTVTVLANGVEVLTRVLGPIGSLVGGLLSLFAGLPTPVQAAAAAFAAFKLAGSYLDNLRAKTTAIPTGLDGMRAAAVGAGTGLEGAATSSSKLVRAIDALKPDGLIRFNEQAKLQAQLASASGESVSKLGSYYAVAQQRAQGFTDAMARVKSAAEGSGTSISTAGAAVQVFSEKSATIAKAADSFTTVRDRILASGQAADGSIGAFTRLTGGIGGVAAASGSLVKTGLGGLIGALGGPWGLAITAGVTALGFLADAHRRTEADAAALVARQQELKGTLNETTGAITDNTRQNIAAKEVESGRAKTVNDLGVSTKLYVDALTGQTESQRLVTDSVTRGNRSLVEQNDNTKILLANLKDYGITLDDLNGYSLGNAASQDKVNAAIAKYARDVGPEAAAMLDIYGGKLKDAAAANKAIVDQLVQTNAMLTKSKEELLATQQAADIFAASMKLITEGGVFEGIARGGPLLASARDQLDKLGASAQRSALDIGKNALQMGSIEGAVAKGTAAMEQMRAQFIKAATDAGLSAAKARELADAAGLIPAVTEFQIKTNADETLTDLFQVNTMVANLPPGKSVVVDALTDEARSKLQSMGFEIKQLPNGSFEIVAHDQAARDALNSFIQVASTSTATVKVDADQKPANGKIQGTLDYGNGQVAKITLDAKPDPAHGAIDGTVTYGNKQIATITLNGNRVNADGTINAVVDYGNGRTAIIKVDAATAAAEAAINEAARRRTAYIDVVTQTHADGRAGGTGRPNTPQAMGGIVSPMAAGGIAQFAGGGYAYAGRKLRSMQGGLAKIVPPNTWRVVGDRLRDDEAYIPINASSRSRQIFEETARRMGYTVARAYADGGFAGRELARAVTLSAVQSSGGNFGPLVAEVRALRKDVTGLQRSVQVNFGDVIARPDENTADAVARRMRTVAALGIFR
ncbi:hypothetical protein GCM10009836_68960 [Pseudonocardia ailaonensis]|uniref:Phage tail tape measure protein domain-containing protein n=1 Tax=Pseudonocardia ailaonensis TaxID=367279 RepID=A0ABN2NNI0_9PSEU